MKCIRSILPFGAVLACAMLSACNSEPTLGTSESSTSSSLGKVEVSIDLGPVGVLARSFQMSPKRLILNIGNLWDTIQLTGSAKVTKSYSISSMTSHTLLAGVYDQRDSMLYLGSKSFFVQPWGVNKVNLSLDARYSSVRLKFPVRDSLTRFVLKVDGAVWGDSSVAKQSRVGDTILMQKDYLRASDTGTLHAFSLKVYGTRLNFDTVLYSLDTNLKIVSGDSKGRLLNLKWVANAPPPYGQIDLSVALGSVGQVDILVQYGDSSSIGSFVDPRDGKKYSTVLIGRQVWLQQNLMYAGAKSELGTCSMHSTSVCTFLGRLYSLKEALAESSKGTGVPTPVQGLCPAGWHLPSDADWSELKFYADPTGATSGLKLMSKSSPNMDLFSGHGTDDFNFRAYLSGAMKPDSTYIPRTGAVWWASEGTAWSVGVSHNGMKGGAADPTYGYSIRCLKNP